MSLTVFIDMSKYTEEISEAALALIAKEVEARAVRKVRVGKTGNLRASIQSKPIGRYEWITFSQTKYALAQEYGLAPFGKPNYSYTPYMTPAVKETEANLGLIIRKAESIAIKKSRVNKKYD